MGTFFEIGRKRLEKAIREEDRERGRKRRIKEKKDSRIEQKVDTSWILILDPFKRIISTPFHFGKKEVRRRVRENEISFRFPGRKFKHGRNIAFEEREREGRRKKR